MGWQERSLCAQTDPGVLPREGRLHPRGEEVCMSCEVRMECLEYALANDERFRDLGWPLRAGRRRLKKQAV